MSNTLTFTVIRLPKGLGDVNRDNFPDIVDALLVVHYYVGLNPSWFYPDAADVDDDGIIDIVNALLIAMAYVTPPFVFPVSQDVEIIGSEIPRNSDPQPETGDQESVVEGINQFAFDCFQLLKEEDDNIFFSPISISYAFTICYAGANSTTLMIYFREDRLMLR